MSEIAAAGSLVGVGISIYGDITSANDQAKLDQDKAAVAQQQAQEIAAREGANETIRNQVAARQKLQFGSSYAASGKAGVGVGGMLQIQNQTDLQNMVSNREATFQEQMLNEQSGIDTTMANQQLQALPWEVAGAVLGGAGGAGKIATAGGSNPGYDSSPQGLGAYPSAAGPNLGVDTSMGVGALGGGA